MGALSIANEMPSDRPGVTTVSKGKKTKKKVSISHGESCVIYYT